MKKEINRETFTYANYTHSRSKIEINKNNDDELFMRVKESNSDSNKEDKSTTKR